MHNTITLAEIKRRGMAAIEKGLRLGPLHIIKRNKASVVILTEEEYQRLLGKKPEVPQEMTALQWLMAQPTTGKHTKARIDAALSEERDW